MKYLLTFLLCCFVHDTFAQKLPAWTCRYNSIDTARPQAGQYMILNGPWYDLDYSGLTPDSYALLDSVTAFLNTLPGTISYLVECHTDCRSSYDYNRELTQRRADTIAAVMTWRYHLKGSIKGVGMGESHPVNNCRCEGKEKIPCSEAQHQENRRTIIRITGLKP